MESTEPLEVGSDAPVLKHVNQVLHWRDAAKLCQWEEAEAETIEREDQYRLAKRHLARYGSIERRNAFTKTQRLAPLLDQTQISNELRKPCERGTRTHNCLDVCRTAPEVVLRWRKLWYSMPKSDRDSRLADMFRRSKERVDDREEDFKVCREAFMIITGIHTEAIQRARMLAQGIAPLTLGKWVSERSLSYRQCRAWLLDYAKVHADTSPMEDKLFLPCAKKQHYWALFYFDLKKHGHTDIPSRDTFLKAWRVELPFIVVRPPFGAFSSCGLCDFLKMMVQTTKDQGLKEQLILTLGSHV